MEISVYSLGSGSKGNCFVLSDGKTNIMIDAGLSVRATISKLAEIGLRLQDVSGILLTHEHNDHVRSLAQLSTFLPVYSHGDTLSEVEKIDGVRLASLNAEEKGFCIGNFFVTPFDVSHDAAHPYGFVVETEKEKLAYVTDTGYISNGIMKKIDGCGTVVLESNHDKELLMRGGYPERLKRRILSDKGHLSNDETALAVRDLAKSGTKRFMLAHLSENNNLGELAYWTTARLLSGAGIRKEEVTVAVASQRETVIL